MVKRTMTSVVVARTPMVLGEAKFSLSCRLRARAYAMAPLRPGERGERMATASWYIRRRGKEGEVRRRERGWEHVPLNHMTNCMRGLILTALNLLTRNESGNMLAARPIRINICDRCTQQINEMQWDY